MEGVILSEVSLHLFRDFLGCASNSFQRQVKVRARIFTPTLLSAYLSILLPATLSPDVLDVAEEDGVRAGVCLRVGRLSAEKLDSKAV